MIQAAFGGDPFSADVRIWIESGGERLPISHLAPTWFRYAAPASLCLLPETTAVIMTSIDGRLTSHTVRVEAPESDATVRYRPADSVPF